MMLEIPDVLSAEEVRRFRVALDSCHWQDGRTTAGGLVAGVKNNLQVAPDDKTGIQLSEAVLQRLGAIDRFVAWALPLKVLPPRFNRYEGGGSYGGHVDNAIFHVPGTPHRIRSDLSATLFLSAPDEYDGGELVIGGRPPVKLPAGHMLVYSGSTIHEVMPVTRGARLAAFFWIQSLIRDDSRRTMLVELDESIRALRATAPGNEAIMRLAGVYHNLLRHWAET